MNLMSNAGKVALASGILESSRMLVGACNSLFLLSKGLSYGELANLQSVYMLGKILFEIPTGLFADRYGSKLVACLACIIFSIYYSLYAAFDRFYLIVFFQLLYGLAMSLISGTLEGWIVRLAQKDFPENTFAVNYFGHLRRQVVGVGNMISGPAGAICASYLGYAFVYIVAALVSLILFFAFFRVDEWKKELIENYIEHIKESVKSTLVDKRSTLKYLISICLLTIGFQPLYFFWQPLFVEVVKNDKIFNHYSFAIINGIIFFISSLLIFLFNKKAKTFVLSLNDSKLEDTLLVVCGFTFLLFQIISFLNKELICSIVIFGLINSAVSVIGTILDDQYFKYIKTKFFSTIYSIINLFQNIMSAIFWAIMGKLLLRISVHEMYSITSGVFLIMILFIIFMRYVSIKYMRR